MHKIFRHALPNLRDYKEGKWGIKHSQIIANINKSNVSLSMK